MRLHFVTVPVFEPRQAQVELNSFLSSHRVLTVDRELVTDGSHSAWAICITYLDQAEPSSQKQSTKRAPRVDYREVLPEAQFQVFAKLRNLRKTIAEKEGVPVYAVFSNEQLAEMVTRSVRSLNELEAIAGVGPARRAKYGQAFLKLLAELLAQSEAALNRSRV